MKVVLAAEAVRDLEIIGDYIAQDNPSRASSFIAELLDKVGNLKDFPYGCPLVPRYEKLGIRRRIHGNYMIFYRVDDQQIIVIHVLHSARDYEAILFPEV